MKKRVSIWACAHISSPLYRQNLSFRTQMTCFKTNVTGNRLRIALSNKYGRLSARIRSVTVLRIGKGNKPVPVLFGGKPGIKVPPSDYVWSDETEIEISAGDTLEIRVAFGFPANAASGAGMVFSVHSPPGDHSRDSVFPISEKSIWFLPKRPFDVGEPAYIVSSVDVVSSEGSCVAVLGDSNAFSRTWTEPLSKLIESAGKQTALLNLGISGNRLLSDSDSRLPGKIFGYAAKKRFEWDIAELSGVKELIICIGGNDVFQPGTFAAAKDSVPACEDIEAAWTELAKSAHSMGCTVSIATLTPIGGTESASPARMALIDELNNFIRSCTAFDRVYDFYSLLADETTGSMKQEYDSGDHLHFNKTAGEAIASMIFRAQSELQIHSFT